MTRTRFFWLQCVFLGLFLCCFVVAALYRITPATEDRFNFGLAESGTTVRHTFRLRNATKNELVVNSVKTSCACSVVGDVASRVAPGEYLSVPVKVDVPDTEEPFESSVMVDFGESGRRTLLIQGTVKRISPTKVDFGDYRIGETRTERFVYRGLQRSVAVTGVDYDQSRFVVTYTPNPSSANDFDFVVSTRTGGTAGRYASNLVIRAEGVPDRTIVLTGHVLNRAEAKNDAVVFGQLSEGESRTGEVKILIPYGDRIASIRMDGEVGAVTLGPGQWSVTPEGVVQPVTLKATFTQQILKHPFTLNVCFSDGTEHKIGLTAYAVRSPNGVAAAASR